MSVGSLMVHRRVMGYALKQWRALLLIAVFTGLASIAAALQPLPMKLLVDHALGDVSLPSFLERTFGILALAPTPILLVSLAALLSFGLFALDNMLNVALTRLWTAAGQRMVCDLATDVYDRLQRLSLAFHSRRSLGDSLDRLMTDTWSVYSFASRILASPLQQILTLATVGWVAWRLDPVLAGLSFAGAPLLALSGVFFGRRLKQKARLNREAQSRVLSFVHQTLTAIPIVQAFSAGPENRIVFRRLSDEAVTVSRSGALVRSSYGFANGFIAAAGTAFVLYAGGLRVLSGSLSLGTLLVFVAYMRNLQAATEGLLNLYGSVKPLQVSMERLLEILDADDEERDPESPVDLPALAREQRGRVRFRQVSFGYEPSRPVLHEIDLEALPGETVALVGETGAGKSTLLSLLPRFHDLWEGDILIDDVDIRQVRLADLRKRIAMVLQEPFLLPLTIAENIAYGRPDAHEDEIEAAAAAANAHSFIHRLPEGYRTVLGERGITLSGGERQRIAIARAFLMDAPVLIMDEPTSSLDAQTESALLEALDRLRKDRTTFVIAHRLSTIRGADRVVVLEAGRVTQVGTHATLIQKEGFYARCCRIQGISFAGEAAV